MEANGAGLPVISTNHAGIPDVVLHQKTGILVAEKDVKAMSQAMIDVLCNIDYAKQLGASGKLRIKTHFNMFKHIDKLQHVLKWAVDNK
jgi:glycosyltransferase involved in cell wall biosynthesis